MGEKYVMEENPTDSDLLKDMGTDPEKWAEEFCKRFTPHRPKTYDEPTVRGWFANAIEAGRAAGWRSAARGLLGDAAADDAEQRLQASQDLGADPGKTA